MNDNIDNILKEYGEKITEIEITKERKRILAKILAIPTLSAKEKEKILEIIFIA